MYKSNSKIKIWRKENYEMEEKNLIPTIKYGSGSLLVWGCMDANGVGDLGI